MARLLGIMLLAVTVVTAQASAQQVEYRDLSLGLQGRLHLQGASSSAGDGQGLFFRRARLTLQAELGDRFEARVQPDFSDGDPILKDAYLSVRLVGSHELTIGQFKRPFTNFELASSTNLPVIERDGRIASLDTCTVVSGLCSLNRLTSKLGFDGRDRGVRLRGSLPAGLAYQASVTTGEGANTGDVNDSKSFSGRVSMTRGDVTVGVFGALHDHPATSDDGRSSTRYAEAGGVDVEVGTWRDGFHLLGTLATGNAWTATPGTTFRTAQLLATYYSPVGGELIEGVEPMLRVSWADPDVSTAGDVGVLWTPGFMVYVGERNGLAVNLDVYSSDPGPTETSIKVQTFLYF